MKYKAALISNKGGRANNEDYAGYYQHKGLGCYVVADGLGGHYGGDLAAKAACVSVLDAFKKQPGITAEFLASYLESAGRALEALKNELEQDNAAKTTLVILLAGNNSATWAHVGDSRLYHLKAGRIAYQTRDHSIPQRLVEVGELRPDQIRFHDDRNRLLRVFDSADTSCFTLHDQNARVDKKDAFLLCSDGFWDYVYEAEMEKDYIKSASPRAWLSRMERRLLVRAEKKHDNYTALAVMVDKKNPLLSIISR